MNAKYLFPKISRICRELQMHDFLSEVGLGTERARLEGTQINVENESRKMHKDIFRSNFFLKKS